MWVSAKVYLGLPGKRLGRDDPNVLAAWLLRTRACPERVGTSHPGQEPVTAHLAGHAGAPASSGPLAQPGSRCAWGPAHHPLPYPGASEKAADTNGLAAFPLWRDPLTLRVYALAQ